MSDERVTKDGLPHYEKDDGPLTTSQIQAIREASGANGKCNERFTKTLLRGGDNE